MMRKRLILNQSQQKIEARQSVRMMHMPKTGIPML